MAGNFHPMVGDQALNAKQRVHYVSTIRILYGLAAPGTPTSSPGWQIRQETLNNSGQTTDIDFAGGTAEYGAIWDDRLGLSYS